MGVLEDYANVAEGLLALHQVTGQAHWLSRAGSLLDVVLEQFADAHSGGFFDTAHDAEALVVRPQDPTDNATPSGWSAAANALLCYAALTGSGRHRLAAESALAVVATLAPSHPRFAGWGMAVAEAWLAGPLEIAVVGDDANLRRAALLSTSAGSVLSAGSADAEGVPLLAGRRLVQGAAAAYVCRHFTCQAPVTDAHDLAAALGARVDLLIRPLAYPQDEKM